MTATPDTAPNAATTSTPRPYTVRDLETFDFSNKIKGVPEMGRSVSVSELADYVKYREHNGQGDDKVVRI